MAPCQIPHSSLQRTGEPAGLLGGGVGHVVHVSGLASALHPELIGPEAVDDIERRHMELDRPVHRQHQLGALHPAELRGSDR